MSDALLLSHAGLKGLSDEARDDAIKQYLSRLHPAKAPASWRPRPAPQAAAASPSDALQGAIAKVAAQLAQAAATGSAEQDTLLAELTRLRQRQQQQQQQAAADASAAAARHMIMSSSGGQPATPQLQKQAEVAAAAAAAAVHMLGSGGIRLDALAMASPQQKAAALAAAQLASGRVDAVVPHPPYVPASPVQQQQRPAMPVAGAGAAPGQPYPTLAHPQQQPQPGAWVAGPGATPPTPVAGAAAGAGAMVLHQHASPPSIQQLQQPAMPVAGAGAVLGQPYPTLAHPQQQPQPGACVAGPGATPTAPVAGAAAGAGAMVLHQHASPPSIQQLQQPAMPVAGGGAVPRQLPAMLAHGTGPTSAGPARVRRGPRRKSAYVGRTIAGRCDMTAADMTRAVSTLAEVQLWFELQRQHAKRKKTRWQAMANAWNTRVWLAAIQRSHDPIFLKTPTQLRAFEQQVVNAVRSRDALATSAALAQTGVPSLPPPPSAALDQNALAYLMQHATVGVKRPGDAAAPGTQPPAKQRQGQQQQALQQQPGPEQQLSQQQQEQGHQQGQQQEQQQGQRVEQQGQLPTGRGGANRPKKCGGCKKFLAGDMTAHRAVCKAFAAHDAEAAAKAQGLMAKRAAK